MKFPQRPRVPNWWVVVLHSSLFFQKKTTDSSTFVSVSRSWPSATVRTRPSCRRLRTTSGCWTAIEGPTRAEWGPTVLRVCYPRRNWSESVATRSKKFSTACEPRASSTKASFVVVLTGHSLIGALWVELVKDSMFRKETSTVGLLDPFYTRFRSCCFQMVSLKIIQYYNDFITELSFTF